MFNIIKKRWSQWNVQDHGNLMKDLKRRGVDKDGVLPNYHYRDDAILLWKAIEKYVTAFVNNVYGELREGPQCRESLQCTIPA